MKRRLVRFLVKKGVYTIQWEVFQGESRGYDSYTLSCTDVPRPELLECLQALAPYVAELCELTRDGVGRMTMLGVSLGYRSESVFYLTMHAKKLLLHSKMPLVLHTPPRPNVGEESAFCMSSSLAYALAQLTEEVWKYVDGDRAQLSLDLWHKGVA